jgi:ribonuclease VapC
VWHSPPSSPLNHPACLNLGNCFAYALARETDVTLLFKGDDFGLIHVASAIAAE